MSRERLDLEAGEDRIAWVDTESKGNGFEEDKTADSASEDLRP